MTSKKLAQSAIQPTFTIHDVYALRDIAAFKRLVSSKRIVGGSGSSSKSSGTTLASLVGSSHINHHLNRRDGFGRTILHVLAGSVHDEDEAAEYMGILLASREVQINARDDESGYTALHRALYLGNMRIANLLFSHPLTDFSIRDREGLTAFDLWSVTWPTSMPEHCALGTDLYTWGANKNMVLGTGNDKDRPTPERIHLPPLNNPRLGKDAFSPVMIRTISMSKLHSALITTEATNNVRICGYGGKGRLGRAGNQPQFSFEPLLSFTSNVSAVALGQDHTLLLSSTGELFSFGSNQYGQLGYSLDQPADPQDMVQLAPRKVTGLLKKEKIDAIGAGKLHSIALSENSLYTWGYDRGQLGYQPVQGVQSIPRKVTSIDQPVQDIAATEHATGCLLLSGDVVVLWSWTHVKIIFPPFKFPGNITNTMSVKMPKPTAKGLVASGTTFAALTEDGEVFSWLMEPPPANGQRDRKVLTKVAQRVWSLRDQLTAATDIAVGLDGSLLLCTTRGDVLQSKARHTQWKRLPRLHRVVQVSATSGGAFSAVRAAAVPPEIPIDDSSFRPDLLRLMPHFDRYRVVFEHLAVDSEEDPEGNEENISRDIEELVNLCQLASNWTASESITPTERSCDMDIVVNGISVPVHESILRSRIPVPLEGLGNSAPAESGLRLRVVLHDCSLLSGLLLLHFLYGDDLPRGLWMSSAVAHVQRELPKFNLELTRIREELRALAKDLQLSELERILSLHSKVNPAPTLARDLSQVIDRGDVTLALMDGECRGHSSILRARCQFFEMLFEDPEWTSNRGGSLVLDFRHIPLEVGKMILIYIYTDVDPFETCEKASSDEFIDLVTAVLVAADELLLDRLKSLCASVLRSMMNVYNVVSIIADAATYAHRPLQIAGYMFLADQLESAVDLGLLAAMPSYLLGDMGDFVRNYKMESSASFTSDLSTAGLLEKHADYLTSVDIGIRKPIPQAKSIARLSQSPEEPRSLPVFLASPLNTRHSHSPEMPKHPELPLLPLTTPPEMPVTNTQADIFVMDEELEAVGSGLVSTPSSSPWTPVRVQSQQNLRAIMSSQGATDDKRPPPPHRIPQPVPPITSTNQPGGRGSAGPWRRVEHPEPSLTEIQLQQKASITTAAMQLPSIPATATSTRKMVPPQPSSIGEVPKHCVSDPASAAGGTVITPGRSNSTRPNLTRTSPWTNYASSTSQRFPEGQKDDSRTARSFSSIQAQQNAEGDALRKAKSGRSLADIQREEEVGRQKEKEKEEAAAFQRWWEQESRQVQAQNKGIGQSRGEGNNRGRGKRSRKGGRGKGQRGTPQTT